MNQRKKPKASQQIKCFNLFCLIILFLVACTSQENNVIQTTSVSPTSTIVSITATPSLTQTPRPTFTNTITPTVDVIASLATEFDVPPVCLFHYKISKDRSWIGADCNVSKELLLIQKDSKNKIKIPYQDILDKNPNAFNIMPLSWASDNQYFYFTTSLLCCTVYNQYEGNGSLYQYDTKNKTLNILVHAVQEPYYFFTDDGNRYIYFNQHSYFTLEIGMVDVPAGKNKRVVLDGYILEDPKTHTWSKSMDKFAIVIWELQFRNNTPGSVLLMINFRKMDMQIIKEFNVNDLLGEN